MQFSLGFIELRCYRLSKESNWPLIVVPNFLQKTKEVTRAVVKIVYEEKKPDVQVEALEESKSTSKTNFSMFISDLPSNIRDNFKSYIEHWMKIPGYIIYWGKVGFSLRIPRESKLATIFEAYPNNLSILHDKWGKQLQIPSESYQKYRDELMKSSTVGSAIASGRKYLNYDDLAPEDVILILHAIDKLVDEISQIRE